MAILSKAEYKAKYDLIFADNITREITESDLREFVEDTKDSFYNIIDFEPPSSSFGGLTGQPTDNANLVNYGNGLVNTIRGGVAVDYNTLKKLFDLVIGGDFLNYNGRAYLYRFGGTSFSVAGTNTYTATINPTPGGYSSSLRYFVNFTNTNTGASTLNINGLGARDIRRADGTTVGAGDLRGICLLAYNGTYFQLVGGKTSGLNGGTP